MLGVIDLATKESDPRAVFLRVVNQLEGVVSRARAAAQDPDDEIGIVLRQFLHSARAMIDDLEEQRSPGLRNPGQRANDVVVDELAQLLRSDVALNIGIEHFEEVTKLLSLRFLTELFEGGEGFVVLFELVDERNRIKAEVGTGKVCSAA